MSILFFNTPNITSLLFLHTDVSQTTTKNIKKAHFKLKSRKYFTVLKIPIKYLPSIATKSWMS